MNNAVLLKDHADPLYINSFLNDCIDQAERDPAFFEALFPIFKKIAVWINTAAAAKNDAVDNASPRQAIPLGNGGQDEALLIALRRNLTAVRDMFEPPAVGSELEDLWLEAMSDFSVIPDYISAQLRAHGVQVQESSVVAHRPAQR